MKRDLVAHIRVVESSIFGIEPLENVGVNGLVDLLLCFCHCDGPIV